MVLGARLSLTLPRRGQVARPLLSRPAMRAALGLLVYGAGILVGAARLIAGRR